MGERAAMLARGGQTRQASRHCTVPEHATTKDFAPAPRVLWDSCWERAGGRRQGGRGSARHRSLAWCLGARSRSVRAHVHGAGSGELPLISIVALRW